MKQRNFAVLGVGLILALTGLSSYGAPKDSSSKSAFLKNNFENKYNGKYYRVQWNIDGAVQSYPFTAAHTDVLDIQTKEKNVRAFASKVRAPSATKSSVAREWKQAQKLARGKVLSSQCDRPTPFLYTCQRVLKRDGEYELTKMAWDGDGHKTLFRIGGLKGKADLQWIAKSVQFEGVR